MSRFTDKHPSSRASDGRSARPKAPRGRRAPVVEKRRAMHPRDREELRRTEGVVVTPPVPAHRKYAAPALPSEEKAEWYKRAWIDAGLPKGAFSALVSAEDPLDGGYGESYSTAQDHFGKYVFKAISRDYDKNAPLELSERHRALYRAFQAQLGRPHLAALRAALVAVHVRSVAGNGFALLVQIHRASAAVIGEAKKFAEWAMRLPDGIVSVQLLLLRQTVPAALGNVPANAELRPLAGPAKLEVDFPLWNVPLLVHPLEGCRAHRALWSEMVDDCMRLLQLRKDDGVVDLCSGSGAIALEASRRGAFVVALDRKPGVEEMLALNAARLKTGRPRFVRAELDANALARVLDRIEGHRKVVLDLPGMQTPPGIPQICKATNVDKIARFFGNLHQLREELDRWRHHGYMLHRAKAYDTRPGGPGLEVLALFRRDSSGLLDGSRRPAPRANARRPRGEGKPEGSAPTVRFRQSKSS